MLNTYHKLNMQFELLEWEIDEEGMHVAFPEEKPCDFAYVIKIERN